MLTEMFLARERSLCWDEIAWNVHVIGNKREKGTAKGVCDVI